MKKLEERGLTLNYQKCQIGLTFIEHLRNTLSDQGLQVSRDRVDTIVHVPRPGTVLLEIYPKLSDCPINVRSGTYKKKN